MCRVPVSLTWPTKLINRPSDSLFLEFCATFEIGLCTWMDALLRCITEHLDPIICPALLKALRLLSSEPS